MSLDNLIRVNRVTEQYLELEELGAPVLTLWYYWFATGSWVRARGNQPLEYLAECRISDRKGT